MIKPEVIEFCENHKVSIRQFIQENDLSNLDNLISVSMHFAYRYPKLVTSGKLVVVEDAYHRCNVYVNPRIIADDFELQELKSSISSLMNGDASVDLVEIVTLLNKIENLKDPNLYSTDKNINLTRIQKKMLENN